jgi:hypothetical protein
MPNVTPVAAPREPPDIEDGGGTAATAQRQPTVAAEQVAEIRLWRGYVKCQLFVAAEGADGALVESPFFRLRNPMAPDDAAQRILDDLLVDLERAGWVAVESGPGWFRRRLRRPTPSA